MSHKASMQSTVGRMRLKARRARAPAIAIRLRAAAEAGCSDQRVHPRAWLPERLLLKHKTPNLLMAAGEGQPGTEGALAVLRTDAGLATSSGTPILAGLPHEATTTAAADGLSCVVGVRPAGGAPSSLFETALGKLACTRFLALSRISIWWMSPAWGSSAAEVPGETQFLLLELADSSYALLLPLIDGGRFRGTLRPLRQGSEEVVLRMESGDSTVLTDKCPGALLVAAGLDPYELIQRAVTQAARLSGTAKHRSQKQIPPSVDCFGWCTWDAFYSRVSAAGIQQGLQALVGGGAPPGFLIIDDGWQQTDVDLQYRKAAAAGCIGGGQDAGQHLGVAKAVEEAAAELLSSPDNHMDQTLHAVHEIQAEEQQGPEPGNGTLSPELSLSGVFSTVHAWLASAYSMLCGWAGALQTSFLLGCKRLLDETPAGSWRMRLFSALATGPFRSAILSFYAEASDHTRRLCSVRANSKFSSPDAGPEFTLNSTQGDLKQVVAHLKQQFGLRHVYAWHAMGGFWGGLSLAEREMQRYEPRLVMPMPTPGLLELDPAVAWVQPVLAGVSIPANPSALHSDMHQYLAECGIDGVKVDVQSTIGLVGSGAGGGPALAAQFHASLEDSARRHFPGNQLINCMCHSTEDLYQFEDTNLARASDDFWPLLPASHTTHIANCAFNSLFMGELVICDWDMFHSKHLAAVLHATARTVSGGPVYVSDRPGQHDFGLLRRLVLPDGSVLRCRLPGRPTADCLLADVCRDGRTPLKVWNVNAVSGVVGVFNIQGSGYSRALRRFHTHDPTPPALTAAVSPADVPALRGAVELFAVYCDGSKELEVLQPNGNIPVTLAGGGGSDVVTISPVHEAAGVRLAPIGLVGMLNAGGAVLSCSLTGGAAGADSSGSEEAAGSEFELVPLRCTMELQGCGGFLCYASQRPAAVLVDGQEVEFTYDSGKASLSFEVPAGASMRKQCQVLF